jgi:hypothetical protein
VLAEWLFGRNSGRLVTVIKNFRKETTNISQMRRLRGCVGVSLALRIARGLVMRPVVTFENYCTVVYELQYTTSTQDQ